jgi:hypothetical protein
MVVNHDRQWEADVLIVNDRISKVEPNIKVRSPPPSPPLPLPCLFVLLCS